MWIRKKIARVCKLVQERIFGGDLLRLLAAIAFRD
jgi:hypothetical protein